jgi:hypothetical protein
VVAAVRAAVKDGKFAFLAKLGQKKVEIWAYRLQKTSILAGLGAFTQPRQLRGFRCVLY